MRNRTFGFVLLLFVAVGAGIAFPLGALHKLQTWKLLNVVGILYGLLGAVVLSEFVTQSARWRTFVVNVVSGLSIWSHGAVPLGTIVTAAILYYSASAEYPSSSIVARAFFDYFVFAMLPTSVIEAVVFNPIFDRLKDPLMRTRIFGLSLVVVGMIVQLVAAIQDLLAP